MRISDPLRMNDWDIYRFLGAVLSIQIMALIAISIETEGGHLPILRPLVCFIYLTFIPGFLILRAMNLRDLGSARSVLYATGLSLATLMFIGALINVAGPYLGVARPISIWPIMAALTAMVLILSAYVYLRDRKDSGRAQLDLREALSPPALLLCILPFLAILGTYQMNFYGVNTLLVLVIIAAAAIILLAGLDLFVPAKLFPLAIFTIALALLFHNSLISQYLNGWDIHQESYYASQVIANGFWDRSIFDVLNAMLSITMIAPIYSIVTGMGVVWTFKIIYPFLFALAPVGLYEAFKTQANEKIAFMSSALFVSLVIFYTEMLQLARQEIAELFLALILLLIVDHGMKKSKWSALFVIFSFSLALSHYGLTYIFAGAMVATWAIVFLSRNARLNGYLGEGVNRWLSLPLILALVAFCALWYIGIAGSNAAITILSDLNGMTGSMHTGLLNPDSAQGMALINMGGTASALHKLYLYLMLFMQLIIVIGIAASLATGIMRNRLARMSEEFFSLSLVMAAILAAGIAVPLFASALNTTRLFQIALAFLAIFFVTGWLDVSRLFGRLIRRNSPPMRIAFGTMAVFLAIFLIFNTGLIFEVAGDVSISYSLNRTADSPVNNGAEVAAANWVIGERNVTLADNGSGEYYTPPIYSDAYRMSLMIGRNADQVEDIPGNYSEILPGACIFLGTYNIENNEIMVTEDKGTLVNSAYESDSPLLNNRSRIYANGKAEIYR